MIEVGSRMMKWSQYSIVRFPQNAIERENLIILSTRRHPLLNGSSLDAEPVKLIIQKMSSYRRHYVLSAFKYMSHVTWENLFIPYANNKGAD